MKARRPAHRGKIAHRTRSGALLHLAGTYWRYWRNSRFRALPDLRSRSVYPCDQGDDGRHWHVGRNSSRPARPRP